MQRTMLTLLERFGEPLIGSSGLIGESVMWRIENVETGTDLGEYEADSGGEALQAFLEDTGDDELDPMVKAVPLDRL